MVRWLIAAAIVLATGTAQWIFNLVIWLMKANSLVSLTRNLPEYVGWLMHPLAGGMLIAAGFVWLVYQGRDRTASIRIYDDAGRLLPISRQPVFSVAAAAVVAGCIVAVVGLGVAYVFATGRISSQPRTPVAEAPKAAPPAGPQAELPKMPSPSPAPPTVFIDPVVRIQLGRRAGKLNAVVTIRNSGIEPVVDATASIRCFEMRNSDDHTPGLRWLAAWWKIGVLTPNRPQTKDASDWAGNCLGPETVSTSYFFVLDLVYRRKIDHKEYRQSEIAPMHRDKSGEVVFWPLFRRSPLHGDLIRDCLPPGWFPSIEDEKLAGAGPCRT
jgi:hypothetical protein